MIKDFLQFIKKTILAVKLSRQGFFLPLSKTQTFRYAKIPAQIFSKQNIYSDSSFLSAQNLLPLTMIEEILTAAPLCGFPLCFLPCSEKHKYQNQVEISLASKDFDFPFFKRLFKEICIKDLPQAKGLYEAWQKSSSLTEDRRLYGAALEEINKSSAAIYEIDWIRTSKEKLVLNFKQKAQLTDTLSKSAQENLLKKFAELFFEERILIEAWRGVLCGEDNQVAFLPILNIQELELLDINFAVDHLQKNKKPKNLLQSKIIYAFALLKSYCPDININEYLDSFLHLHFIPKGQGEQKLLSTLNKHGMVYVSKPQIKFQSAKNLTYLLDSHRHKKDARFKKSSSLYIMLLLLAYLLLRYF